MKDGETILLKLVEKKKEKNITRDKNQKREDEHTAESDRLV